MALALVGLLMCWRRRHGNDDLARMARCFSILALITFLLSMGRFFPPYRWFYDLIPSFGWRNPNKFFFTTSFCLVFLAGYGAQVVVEAIEKRSKDPASARLLRRIAGMWWKIAGVLLAGAIVVLVQQSDLILELTERSWTRQEAEVIVSGMGLSLLRATLFWGCWGGLVYAAWRNAGSSPARLPWLACAWIMISVGEMAFVASHYIDYFDYRRALEPHPLLRRVIDDGKRDIFRFKMVVSDSVLNDLYFLQITYHHIQLMDIPSASRIPDDYKRYFEELDHNPVLLWELTNVRYVLAQKAVAEQILRAYGKGRLEWVTDYTFESTGDNFSGFQVKEVPQDDPNSSYELLKLTNPLPRALVVPEIRFASDLNDLFEQMKGGKVNFQKTMLALAPSGALAPEPRTLAKDFGSQIKTYTNNRIVIETHSDQPAYLLLNDKYDSDWRATINGKPARIFRANFIMRGLEIPAGRSEVVFIYEMDRKLLIFTAIAWGAALLFGCLLCIFPGRRKVS